MDTQPIITERYDGEFSTVELPGGVIETMWFGEDGSQVLVGRTYPQTKIAIAEQHISEWEKNIG